MVLDRNSSLDLGYEPGDLSAYPVKLDTADRLYRATNNAETVLRQGLTYAGKYILVEDASKFPDKGILRVGAGPYELVYYDVKRSGVFRDLIRGFAGSVQRQWPAGTPATAPVLAEHFKAVRDAILNIETNLGTEGEPEEESLNWILKTQETRFLSPKPLFRGWPLKGPPPLKVRFQNFSSGPLVRYLWDFGDGTTSVEKHPTHTYVSEGVYSVKLNIVTSLGAQGIMTKSNYVTASDDERDPFFYVTPSSGYSRATAEQLGVEPTEFTLVDQTDGDVFQRYWIFDGAGTTDGVVPAEEFSQPVYNPNRHTIKYIYDDPGEYTPSLLVVFSNQKLKRAVVDSITVL